jgi:hypothetical protein
MVASSGSIWTTIFFVRFFDTLVIGVPKLTMSGTVMSTLAAGFSEGLVEPLLVFFVSSTLVFASLLAVVSTALVVVASVFVFVASTLVVVGVSCFTSPTGGMLVLAMIDHRNNPSSRAG